MFSYKDLHNIESALINFTKELRNHEQHSKDLKRWADELDELVVRVKAERQNREARKAD